MIFPLYKNKCYIYSTSSIHLYNTCVMCKKLSGFNLLEVERTERIKIKNNLCGKCKICSNCRDLFILLHIISFDIKISKSANWII